MIVQPEQQQHVEVLNKAIKSNEDTNNAMMAAVTVLAKQLGKLGNVTQTLSNAFVVSQQQQQRNKTKKSIKRKKYDINISDSDSD